VDVDRIANELGLGPVPDATFNQDISGCIRLKPGGQWEIAYNPAHSEVRRRFTIAHEIGHFIYHRDRLEKGAGTSDTLAYRIDSRIYPNRHIGWLQEYQANNFASNLLIPAHELELARAQGMDEEALAKRFRVSKAAIRIRLGTTPGRRKPTHPA
jgi:Zn-dependent peptidase ImmA (M78 family)